jgi:Arc/MetJ-type ribon-helix-helix transcriptional regulator
MTITVKLPSELEQALRQQCAAEGRSLSEVLRDALTAYLADAPAAPASAWSLGADLFGRHAGPADLAAQRRAHLADAWAQKHARRRADH